MLDTMQFEWIVAVVLSRHLTSKDVVAIQLFFFLPKVFRWIVVSVSEIHIVGTYRGVPIFLSKFQKGHNFKHMSLST